MLCADMVTITWKDPIGKKRRMMGLLEDISASGACLQLDTAIPVGAELRWSSPKKEFAGKVRYCVYREIGYFVGVEFSADSKWSRRTYKPQHLLDLDLLVANAK